MSATLVERVALLCARCESRIHSRRRVETNLGPYAEDTYLAVAERMVYQEVLTMLGHPVPPRNENDLRYRGTAVALTSPRRERGRMIP